MHDGQTRRIAEPKTGGWNFGVQVDAGEALTYKAFISSSPIWIVCLILFDEDAPYTPITQHIIDNI